jgi:intracellular multiplication protein IcmP
MADKQPHDTPMLFALIVGTILLVVILFWLTLSEQISSGIRWVRVGQLTVASMFTDEFDLILDQLKALQPEEITPQYLMIMTEVANKMVTIPIAILMALMGCLAFLKKTQHPFTRKFDLDKIAGEQAENFPVSSPIMRFNPLEANHRTPGSTLPARLPSFAEALSPEEWVSFHSIPIVQGEVDMEAARRAFVKQLGGRWKSAEDLPLHLKALFVAFSMKANGMRVESDIFLGEISKFWQPNKGLVLPMDLRTEIRKKMHDPKFGRVTEKVAAQHAFVATALLRCLQIAREQGGVLAPAQFLWLRAVDRTLWYPMNNLGRAAVHTEAAGAIAHFRAEKAANKPIPNPQVDTAVDGLKFYLRDNDVSVFPAKAV